MCHTGCVELYYPVCVTSGDACFVVCHTDCVELYYPVCVTTVDACFDVCHICGQTHLLLDPMTFASPENDSLASQSQSHPQQQQTTQRRIIVLLRVLICVMFVCSW